MPTERFHKLADDKKRSIRRAVVEEFSRVSYEKASINQIIFNAGISRGSFYTYFEDKKDVLVYILGDSVDKLKDVWADFLEKNGGNIWISSEALLAYTMERTVKNNMFKMMRNLGFSHEAEIIFDQACSGAPGEDYGKQIVNVLYQKTDKSKLNCDDIEKFERLFQMIFMAVLSSLGWYYKKPEDEENLKKNFHEVLEILQYGICKQSLE